jgi:hypothetical protein
MPQYLPSLLVCPYAFLNRFKTLCLSLVTIARIGGSPKAAAA